MKRFVLLFALTGLWIASEAQTILPDTIGYNVNYHWGFINKTAGAGQVELAMRGDTLDASLVGASIPWGGRVYQVHDTLRAVMTNDSIDRNLVHELVIHENGLYTKPVVIATASDGKVELAPIKASKNIYGVGGLNADASTMEAVTITTDMLGLYYYARVVDFDSLMPGQTLVMPIEWIDNPGGEPQGESTLVYRGRSSVEIGGIEHPTWQITFSYTYHGQPSGYNVNCQIDRQTRVPLLLSAQLPIGQLEMVAK